MKKFISCLLVIGFCLVSRAIADVGEGRTFEGRITAIEDSRDSITVWDSKGIVKLFEVAPEQKKQLHVGQAVKVEYHQASKFPYPTESVTVVEDGS